MKTDDRERAIDALLRRQEALEEDASAGAGVRGDDCLDAGLAAAWAEGRVSAAERARLEAHASVCARCEALVGAVMQTVPADERLARAPWWQLSPAGWLVSATGAAAAIVLWMVVPRPEPRDVAPVTPVTRIAEADVDRLRRMPEGVERADATASHDSAAKAGEAVGESRRAESSDESRQKAPLAQNQTLADTAGVSGAMDARSDREPPARAPVAAASPTLGAATEKNERARTAKAAQADALALGLSRLEQVAEEQDRLDTVIASPDPLVRWRIGAPGSQPASVVARSRDGGATWNEQSTGVVAALTAGSAPSPAVCWLVGRGGVVLLFADGRWRPVPSPAAIDLVAIQATNATIAVVTAVDGRTFRTTDAGGTWR